MNIYEVDRIDSFFYTYLNIRIVIPLLKPKVEVFK